MKNRMIGTLLSLLAPLSLVGEVKNVTVSMVGYNAYISHLFYALVTPAGFTVMK